MTPGPEEKHPPSSDNPASPAGPRIALLSASVGSGHNQAARALLEELQCCRPTPEVRFLDTLDFTSKAFRMKYAGGYEFLVTHLPWVYGLGYALTDQPQRAQRSLRERRRVWNEQRHLRRLVEELEIWQPDLILHTHFLAPTALEPAVRAGRITDRQVSVVTDVIPHRWWYCRGMETFYVAHPASAERFDAWGLRDRVRVAGMPIQRKWTERAIDRNRVLAEFNLPSDKPIVLLSGGSQFTCGPIAKLARKIVQQHPDICLVALAGRNKALLGQFSKMAEVHARRIIPLGFTDRMPELCGVASILATKAGGLITAEALAAGTPMLCLKPVPGQEANNARFFTQQGAAVIARTSWDAADVIRDLLDKPETLAAMAKRARALYRPGRQAVVVDVAAKLGIAPPTS
jgi:processive 1,2-diacylglycerol beta-glucosyltransferase